MRRGAVSGQSVGAARAVTQSGSKAEMSAVTHPSLSAACQRALRLVALVALVALVEEAAADAAFAVISPLR